MSYRNWVIACTCLTGGLLAHLPVQAGQAAAAGGAVIPAAGENGALKKGAVVADPAQKNGGAKQRPAKKKRRPAAKKRKDAVPPAAAQAAEKTESAQSQPAPPEPKNDVSSAGEKPRDEGKKKAVLAPVVAQPAGQGEAAAAAAQPRPKVASGEAPAAAPVPAKKPLQEGAPGPAQKPVQESAPVAAPANRNEQPAPAARTQLAQQKDPSNADAPAGPDPRKKEKASPGAVKPVVTNENRDQKAPQTVGKPPETQKAPAIAPIFDQPGVLTPIRTLVLEPSFQYLNTSSNRVALSGYTVIPSLTLGLIDVRNVSSNTYVTSLAARYGLTNRMECEVRVPYVYRSDTTATQPSNTQNQSTPASVFVASGNDLGDIDFGVRYQLNRPEKGEGPYFIGGLRVKSATGKSPFDVKVDPNVTGPDGEPLATELPTGSGFWSFQPSITGLFTSDPVAFFGTLSYMWNLQRTVGGSTFDPGDTVGFNVGAGIALNEKVSVSLGYDHVVLGKTKRNGIDLPGTMVTQIGTLLIGCSYRLNDKTSINFSLGAGLTPAASNVQLTLRVPYTFSFSKK
ncbi:transporter [Geomesophilobacter sediminis]|uniref:Acetate kinase n=1 Tax=Geomesophilobacter sediminis TaxID=2798584 RepID=A0A8J7M3C0_9BACT|nr:transporter [Geomesophilobacter sediminis]MBJ6727970.1 hypothetical protein [Geomesophilobacter sediminis]